MTEADLQDLLLRVESAMLREDVDGWRIERVLNTLIYGEPGSPDAIYNTAAGRILRQQRALAQAQAHERAMDRLQSELRSASEAYAYASALAVRDAAMGLVAQLREDLGEHDPNLIVGEVVQADEARDYGQACASTAASLRRMIGSLDAASPVEAALAGVAGHLAEQLETPSPFKDRPQPEWPQWIPLQRPIPTLRGRRHERAVLPDGCYEARWGWVHVQPSCRCSR
jgi:hypothetical protein